MKATRKLIPALAMLLISAVMMSTASFAWFSTNTTATVDGFNVRIASANTLLVKESSEADTAYATSKNFGFENANMQPVSADKALDDETKKPLFFQIKDNGAGDIKPNSSAMASNTKFAAAATTNYVYKSVTFRATGGEQAGDILGDLYVTITASQVAESGINAAFRIMLVIDSTNVVYVNPFGTEAVKPITEIAEDGTPTEASTTVEQDLTSESITNNVDIVTDFASEATHTVEIYMWYEGQDSSCYANNATNLKNINVSFLFSLISDGEGA